MTNVNNYMRDTVEPKLQALNKRIKSYKYVVYGVAAYLIHNGLPINPFQ